MRPLRLGLVGVGIGHSLSPTLHRAGLLALGRGGSYTCFEAPTEVAFLARVAQLKAGDLDGLNVTTPWKSLAALKCDVVFRCDATGGLHAPSGTTRGPVNTLFMRDGRLVGTSTDGPGLGLALAHCGVVLDSGPIAVIGTGGAGASIAHWLMAMGADLRWLSNRSIASAERLAADLGRRADGNGVTVGKGVMVGNGVIVAPWRRPDAMAAATVVIHASRVGHGKEGEEAAAAARDLQHLPWQAWAKTATLIDLVYGDGATAAQRCAQAAGMPADRVVQHSGRAMLAGQAALSLGIWSGAKPPVAAMLAAAGLGAPVVVPGPSAR